MADEGWSDWIDHYGGEPIGIPPGVQIELEFYVEGFRGAGDIIPDDLTAISPDWPGFFWRWTIRWHGFRDGGYRKCRVCDEPEYAPVTRYRFRIERQASATENHLRALVSSPELAPIITFRPERKRQMEEVD